MPETPEVVKFITHIRQAISREVKLTGEAIGDSDLPLHSQLYFSSW
jgi:hypothetical protein